MKTLKCPLKMFLYKLDTEMICTLVIKSIKYLYIGSLSFIQLSSLGPGPGPRTSHSRFLEPYCSEMVK